MEPLAGRGQVAHTVGLLVSEVGSISAKVQQLWAAYSAQDETERITQEAKVTGSRDPNFAVGTVQ